MTVRGRVKNCSVCGVEFKERVGDSNSQWESRSYCSMKCNNRSPNRITHIFDRLDRYVVKTDQGCWSWVGSSDGHGYGTLSNRSGRKGSPERAHRVSYEKYIGEIPCGMEVRHKCDNPECTNPDHLIIGTHLENMRDMSERNRLNKKSLLNLNHDRALTEQQIQEIKKIKFAGKNGRGGATKKDVAIKYGVCADTIKKALRRS